MSCGEGPEDQRGPPDFAFYAWLWLFLLTAVLVLLFRA